MKTPYIIIHLVILLLASSCDQMRSLRSDIRTILVGKVELEKSDELKEQEQEQAAVSNEESTPEKVAVQLSAKDKVIGLVEALNHSSDNAISTMIVKIIKENTSDFILKNEKLTEAFQRLSDHIKNGNMEIVSILMAIYSNMPGDNKKELGKILSEALDLYPKTFLHDYFLHFADERCELARYLPNQFPKLDKKQQALLYSARKAKISAIDFSDSSEIMIPHRAKAFLEKCVTTIELELFKIQRNIAR